MQSVNLKENYITRSVIKCENITPTLLNTEQRLRKAERRGTQGKVL